LKIAKTGRMHQSNIGAGLGLLNMIHRLNQDANDLRMARDQIQGGTIKLA
jgi:hypothetical protein